MSRRWIRSLFARPARRAARRHILRVEGLETREVPAALSLAGGTLTYAAGAGVNNSISVSISGSNFVVTDTGETITTAIAGATGSGTNTVTVPTAGVTAVALGLGDGSDAVAPAGVVLTTQDLTVTNSGTLLSVGGPVRTTTGNIGLSGANQVTLAGGAQVGGAVTASGTVPAATYTFANQTTGTITIAANTDGAGAEGFDQGGGWLVTNNTTTAAVAVTVNAPGGGTGNAVVGLTSATAAGARYTATAFGGSILWSADAALGGAFSTSLTGTASGGSNTATLRARAAVFSTTGAASAVGAAARPISTDDTAAAITVTAAAGSGGIYVVDWGANSMTVAGATAAGAGAIRLVTANGGGHNLVVNGPVTTGSGAIALYADDDLTLNAAAQVGGAGFSGTVEVQSNRDGGNGQSLLMLAGSSIVTSNGTATAVRLLGNSGAGSAGAAAGISAGLGGGGVSVGNVTVGNGGTITVNAGNGTGTRQGSIVQLAGTLLDAGPAGTVALVARASDAGGSANASAAYAIGNIGVGGTVAAPVALPIRVRAGTVTATTLGTTLANTGTVNVINSVAGSFTANTSGSTTGGISLTTTAGALTVAGATNTGGGPVALSGAAGVVLNAAVGSASTGAVTVTGPLSGTGGITGTGLVTVAQDADSTYGGVIGGAQALTKAGTGNLTLSAAQPYTGATTVTAGTLTVGAGGLTGTSGVAVAAAGALAGAGPVAGPVAVSGDLAPGGTGVAILGTGNLTFTPGGALLVDLAGATTPGTDYDQVAVTGSVTLTNAALRVFVGFTPSLTVGQTFRVVENDGTDAVTGQFTAGATVVAFDNPSYIFTVTTAGGSGNDVELTLATILPPRYLDVVGGTTVSYGTAGAVNSTVSLGVVGGRYVLSDAAGAIGLSGAAVTAGWTVDGPTTVSGPVAGITAVRLGLSDGADAITALDAGAAAVTVAGLGTLTTSGTLTTTGNLTFDAVPTLTLGGTLTPGGTLFVTDAGTLSLTGTVAPGTAATLAATTITAAAGSLVSTPTVTLTAAAVGTAADPVRTQATTVTATGGAGGAFVAEADGATVTATATGAGAVAVTSAGGTLGVTATTAGGAITATSAAGTLSVVGAVSSAGGNIALSSADAVVLGANVNAGAGTVVIAANTDGAGAQGLTQTAGTVTTTNTGAAAASVTVNTAAGGTGTAAIDSFTVGSAAGGRLAVATFGGSVVYGTGTAALDGFQRGVQGNGGADPARLLRANVYSFTTGAGGGVGTDDRPMQIANFGANAVGATANLTAAVGSGGVYVTGWDPAGSGSDTTDLTVGAVTAQGAGNVRVVTANAGGHNLFVTGPVTTGSGSIYLAADDNFDLTAPVGGAGFSGTVYLAGNRDTGNTANLRMFAGSSVVTSNATADAVLLEAFNTGGTRAGGALLNSITVGDGGTITVSTTPLAASQGTVTVVDATVLLTAGPAGRVVFATAPQVSTTSTVGTPALPVRVSAGTVVATSLTTATTTGTTSGIYVTGTGPTAFTARIGGAAANTGNISLATTAGALTINGPTSTADGVITLDAGSNAATLTDTLTLGSAATLAVTAAGGLTVAAGGTLAGTGAAGNATPVAVQPGGTLSPGGALAVGNTTLGTGTLRLDLTSAAAFDSLAVTGTVTLAGGALALVVGPGLAVNDSFVIVSNDGGDAVAGQLADGTSVLAANDPRYVFTLNYAGGDGNDVVATLTQIVTTTFLDVTAAGLVTVASADGLNNTFGVGRTATAYTVTDSAGVITLSPRAVAAGWTGGGTTAVTGPTAGVTGLAFTLNTGADALAAIDAGQVPLSVTGTGSLAVTGAVSSTAGITVTGVTDVTGSPAGVFQAPAVSLTAAGGVGTPAQRVRTTAGAVTATAGAGGVFLAETDGADFAVTTTGGAIDLLSIAGTLNVAAPLTSGGGNVVLSSGDAVTLGANVNAGAGTITVAANTDGAGAQGYDQKAATLTTTNATADALRVTVNTAAGGTGDAVIGQGSVGTATAGGVAVAAFGGRVLWSDDPDYVGFGAAQLGTGSGGSNTQTLKAYTYSFAGAAVGADARPLQLDNAGANGAANAVPNLTAAAGAGGVYVTVWDAVVASDLTLGTVTAQGAGGIRVVTANSAGHNLWVTGNVSTGTGTIYLAADDNLDVTAGVTVGGAGFSGTVWMQANRDAGTAGQTFKMDPTAAILTSSTANAAGGPRTPATQAVYLDIFGDPGTPSVLTVANVTTGAGGRVVLNAVPSGITLEAGRVVMADAANVLTAGTVEVIAGITTAAAGDAVGTAALPLAVAGGSVVLAVNHGNTFVTSAGAAGFSLAATASAAQTAAATTVLRTTAGALTVVGPTATLNGGALSLTGAGGVVVAGPLGSATTGAITLTGPLSGAGDITLGTAGLSLTQDGDSTYAGSVGGAQGVTKAGTGTLTLTGVSPYAGATTVAAGGLLLGGGALAGTSGLAVADTATFGGAGAAGGAAVVSGALAPAGVLALGGLSFGPGPRAVTLDLAAAGSDQLAVTGAVDLAGAALTVNVGFLPLLGTAFTVLTNDGSDPVAGTFAGLAQGATFDVGARTYTVDYAGGDGNDVVLTVTHVTAGPPVNAVPASAAVPEDGFVAFPAASGTRVGVDSAVLGDAVVRVTVAAGNGVLTLPATAGLNFTAGDGTADATMTFTGTLAAINAALDGLRYDPAPNFNGSDTITVTSNDLGATGGPAQTDTDTIAVAVTAVNDVPVFAVGGTHTVAEDAAAQAVPGWATGISAGPADESGQSLTFLVTTSNDALFSVLPAISSSGQLTYTPAPDANGTATVSVRLRDGGGTLNGGADTTAAQTFTIVVTPVNDAPVVGPLAGPVEVPSHGPAAVLIAAGGTAADIDTAVFDAGTLTASVAAGGAAGDVLAIAAGGSVAVSGGVVSVAGTPVGTVAGGTGAAPLTVTFNASATAAAVEAVLRQLVFRTPAVGVPPGDRTVSVGVADGQGGTSVAVTVTVAVLPNVSPTLGGVPAAAAFTENDPALLLAPAGTAGDIDSPTFDDGTLTAALGGGRAGDVLAVLPGGSVTVDAGNVVSFGGTPVGTVTGGAGGAPLVVSFGAADAAAVQAVFRRIGFANASETIAAGPRAVTFTLTDGDGGSSTSPPTTVTVTAVNDAPTLTLPAGPLAATEDVPLTITGVTVADLDAGTGDVRVTLTVTGGRVALATTGGLTVAGNDTPLVGLTGPLSAVTAALATLTFTPTAEFNGAASILVQADDQGHTPGPAKTATGTIFVTVASVNDAPVLAAPATLATSEDVPVAVPAVTVTDADADAGAAPLRLTLGVGQGTLTVPAGAPAAVTGNGTAALTLTGTAAQLTATLAGLTYRPAANFFGSDTLTVSVDDQGNTGGAAQAAGATVPITVAAVNDAPTFGVTSTLFVAEDAGPQTRPGFASGISPGPANESGQSLTFDTVVTGTTGGLTFTQAPQVAADGTLTFTAAPGSNGSAAVRVTLTDGGPGTAPDANATVRVLTITVGGSNDAPAFAAGADQAVAEDAGPQAVPGWATGLSAGPADEAGQALAFLVSTDNPALFAAAPTIGPTGQLTYTPAANATGTATVTVRLRDDGGTANGGSDTSAPQTFTITVTPVNDAPAARNDFIDAVEDGPAVVVAVLANDSADPDAGETLAVVSVGAAAHGTVLLAGGVVTYTPAPNFAGVDSFTYTVSDGNGGTAAAIVRMLVAAVNDAPAAADDTLTVAEDAPATVVPVTANDSSAPDAGETLTVVSFTPAAHGTVTLVGGVLRYAPAAEYSGADAFTYTVSDGNGGTATATVAVTVTPVNDAPTAAGDTLTVGEDGAATAVDVLANDASAPDAGETLTVASFTPAAHGTVTLAGGVLRYAPAAEYSGADAFTYTVSNGNGGTATAVVNVTVTPANDPPVAVDDAAVAAEDGGPVLVPVLANDTSGPETGEALAVTAVSQPANGTTAVVAGGVRYAPAPNFSGRDTFTYTVSDGNGGTATATVLVVVTPTTDAPVAVADAFTLPPGSPATTLAVLANDGPGPDGGATPRVVAVTQPAAGGVVAPAPGGSGVRFVPAAGFAGTTTFTYSIGDGTLAGTATATATVTVSAAGGGSDPRGPLGPVRPVVVGGPADGSVVLTTPGTTTGFITGFAAPGGATRTASADVDGDGVADLVLATGPGAPFRVAVLSGATGHPLVVPFDPFGGGFAGGGFVAAGDIDGDGRAEFVVTPDQGGGPRVSVFGTNPAGSPVLCANFLGIDDANFRGGARAALGDVDADGTPDVVVAAGFGGGPRAAIFDGASVLAGKPARLVNDFLAFPGADAQNLRNGAYVAAGDVDGDGHADLVFGGGPGGAPRVFVLNGAVVSAGRVAAAQAAPLANFFVGGDTADRGGARVAVTNADGDATADVVVGSGAGRPARVRLYLGATFGGSGEPTAIDLDPLGGGALTDGVYVG